MHLYLKLLFLTYDLCLKCVIIHLTVKLFPVSYITTAVVVSIVSEMSNNKKKNEYNNIIPKKQVFKIKILCQGITLCHEMYI